MKKWIWRIDWKFWTVDEYKSEKEEKKRNENDGDEKKECKGDELKC